MLVYFGVTSADAKMRRFLHYLCTLNLKEKLKEKI